MEMPMDFHAMARRDLQALCKKNGIKANLTNAAMADALGALPSVIGIEDFTAAIEESRQGSPLPRSRRVCAKTPGGTRLYTEEEDEEDDMVIGLKENMATPASSVHSARSKVTERAPRSVRASKSVIKKELTAETPVARRGSGTAAKKAAVETEVEPRTTRTTRQSSRRVAPQSALTVTTRRMARAAAKMMSLDQEEDSELGQPKDETHDMKSENLAPSVEIMDKMEQEDAAETNDEVEITAEVNQEELLEKEEASPEESLIAEDGPVKEETPEVEDAEEEMVVEAVDRPEAKQEELLEKEEANPEESLKKDDEPVMEETAEDAEAATVEEAEEDHAEAKQEELLEKEEANTEESLTKEDEAVMEETLETEDAAAVMVAEKAEEDHAEVNQEELAKEEADSEESLTTEDEPVKEATPEIEDAAAAMEQEQCALSALNDSPVLGLLSGPSGAKEQVSQEKEDDKLAKDVASYTSAVEDQEVLLMAEVDMNSDVIQKQELLSEVDDIIHSSDGQEMVGESELKDQNAAIHEESGEGEDQDSPILGVVVTEEAEAELVQKSEKDGAEDDSEKQVEGDGTENNSSSSESDPVQKMLDAVVESFCATTISDCEQDDKDENNPVSEETAAVQPKLENYEDMSLRKLKKIYKKMSAKVQKVGAKVQQEERNRRALKPVN